MAETEAEKKKIAELYFGYDTNNLNKLEQDINEINKKATTLNEKLKLQINIDSGSLNTLNTNLEKVLSKTVNISDKNAEKIKVNAIKTEQELTAKIKLEEEKRITNNQKTANEILVNQQQEVEKRITNEKKIADKTEEYNNRIANSSKTMYDKIAGYAETYLLYQGFNMLKNAISDVIDEMVNLESEMVQIDRVLNEDSLNVDNYRDKLIQLAYDYGNSIDNVTDVTLRLAQAGFNSQESLALTEKTLLALNTAELDATEATSDMVAVMAQWGLMTGDVAQETQDYADIIDKINKIADNYPTTSADLMDALKKTSSAFNIAGASIDETLATITAAEVASQRGGKAIGTALSNITQQLKESSKLTIAESLGLDFYTDETKTEFKDIMTILQEMADKMQTLKDAGKENSTEMQELLSIFTVFRRNIGSSLLGEMSGEDSTYLQVLNDSLTATGYSLQENEKYMKTTAAAQQQFNAELLKLKTEVWDNGVEEVYRNLLSSGKDLIEKILELIDKIGLVPTVVGVATLAFTAFNKNLKVDAISKYINEIKAVQNALKNMEAAQASVGESTKSGLWSSSVLRGLKNYTAQLVTTTIKTVALTAANIALNAAISMGLSVAITAITTAIDNWINAQEKAIEKNNELKQQAEDDAATYTEEANSIKDLGNEYEETMKQYEQLKASKSDTTDTETKLYELQTQINEALDGTGKQVDIIKESTDEYGKKVVEVNEKYEKQLAIIQAITYEKEKQSVEELKKAKEAAEANLTTMTAKNTAVGQIDDIQKLSKKYGGTNFVEFQKLDWAGQYKQLAEWQSKLEEAGETGSKTYKWITERISDMKEKQETATEATEAYIDALGDLYLDTGAISTYSENLNNIAKTYNKLEGPNKLINSLQSLNQQFTNGEITSKEYFDGLQEKIKEIDFSVLNDKVKDGAKELKELSKQTVNAGETVSEESEKAQMSLATNVEGAKKVTDDFVENLEDNVDTSGAALEKLTDEEKENLEAYQAIFAETTELVAENLSNLIANFEDGQMSFSEYSDALGESAESTLDLYTQLNGLNFDEQSQQWLDAAGNVDEYANSLQGAMDNLQGMSEMLGVIGDNYDYISEHALASGEAAFTTADMQTQAYQNLATNFANSLNGMVNTNNEAYNAIVNKVYDAMGTSANEVANADEYIVNALNTNNSALNAALNEAASQTSQATNRVTNSMANVISSLGKAISNFSYNLEAKPYISGGFGLKKDDDGVPIGIELPTFGFNITGTGGDSVSELGNALSSFGSDLSTYASNQFKYTTLKNAVSPYKSSGSTGSPTSTTTPSSTKSSGSSGSGNSGSSGTSSSSSSSSTSTEDDTYKTNLALFEDYVSEKERLEQRWVSKQKELGQLSNKDYLYITQQRIKRYQEYLDEVKNMTWLSTEDREALEKEYTEKIEDLQVDYLGYLQDVLNDEIDAIKDANEKKIQLIEDEADAKIAALKKVEDATSRSRKEQDYYEERQEILEDISYWEQRTGREAAESLKESKEKLAELDKEWQEQLEDWSIEDQIQAIEDERDAEIAAIEDSQEAQIASLQAVYDERVKLYAETGQLIYDQSQIESSNLYNAYKDNFVNPIISDLNTIQKKISSTTAAKSTTTTTTTSTPTSSAQQQQYETYTIKWGDTLTSIAKKYNTTIDKIMAANPYVTNKNKIYAGKTLQIPKFHEGGIVGGNQEAFALLKPNEVILKPEWSASLNRMMKYFDNVTAGNTTSITNGPTINVDGDMVKIEASVRNQSDIDAIGKKVEKVLKDKFNIKK
jgi:TP901 family phage tail tape measure protein